VTKVGIITEYYDPETGSAAVPGYISRALSNLGYEVEVLTTFPNYPDGRVFKGYRQKFRQRDRIDGIAVTRVPMITNHSSNVLSRSISYASFAVSALLNFRVLRDCDVIVVYSTPVTVGLGAALIGKTKHRKVISFIQDLWPETMFHSGLVDDQREVSFMGEAAEKICNWIYSRSDGIAVISEGMKSRLVSRGVDEEKISVIHNWVSNEILEITDAARASYTRPEQHDGKFRVIYAGSLGRPQGLKTIVEAAYLLTERADIEFQIIGEGNLRGEIEDYIERNSMKNIHLGGPVSAKDVPAMICSADVQLVSLAANKVYSITIPSKLQFSLAQGKPIIALLDGDPAEVAQMSGAALICEPENAQQLASAIKTIASYSESRREEMGISGRKYADQNFTESVGAESLSKFIQKING